MKQGKLRPWFRMLGMTILGSAIFALGFDLFLLPNQINIGGVSGIGMLLLELTGWGSVGLYSILINVPLFILGGKRLGRQFFFGSLAGMLTSSLLMDVFTRITPPQTEILLSALYGGIFSGVGLGLVFLGGRVHRRLGYRRAPAPAALRFAAAWADSADDRSDHRRPDRRSLSRCQQGPLFRRAALCVVRRDGRDHLWAGLFHGRAHHLRTL